MAHLKYVLEYQYDRYKNDYIDIEKTVAISNKEATSIIKLTPKMLYEHLQKGIGKVTPKGVTKFLPTYKLGKLKISLQYAYYLWSYRDDLGIYENTNSYGAGLICNNPITKKEFNHIIPNIDTLIDVQVMYDKEPVIQATQMSIREVVEKLQNMLEGVVKSGVLKGLVLY